MNPQSTRPTKDYEITQLLHEHIPISRIQLKPVFWTPLFYNAHFTEDDGTVWNLVFENMEYFLACVEDLAKERYGKILQFHFKRSGGPRNLGNSFDPNKMPPKLIQSVSLYLAYFHFSPQTLVSSLYESMSLLLSSSTSSETLSSVLSDFEQLQYYSSCFIDRTIAYNPQHDQFLHLSKISYLPDELLCEIFSYLSLKDLQKALQVSSQFRRVGLQIWQSQHYLRAKKLVSDNTEQGWSCYRAQLPNFESQQTTLSSSNLPTTDSPNVGQVKTLLKTFEQIEKLSSSSSSSGHLVSIIRSSKTLLSLQHRLLKILVEPTELGLLLYTDDTTRLLEKVRKGERLTQTEEFALVLSQSGGEDLLVSASELLESLLSSEQLLRESASFVRSWRSVQNNFFWKWKLIFQAISNITHQLRGKNGPLLNNQARIDSLYRLRNFRFLSVETLNGDNHTISLLHMIVAAVMKVAKNLGYELNQLMFVCFNPEENYLIEKILTESLSPLWETTLTQFQTRLQTMRRISKESRRHPQKNKLQTLGLTCQKALKKKLSVFRDAKKEFDNISGSLAQFFSEPDRSLEEIVPFMTSFNDVFTYLKKHSSVCEEVETLFLSTSTLSQSRSVSTPSTLSPTLILTSAITPPPPPPPLGARVAFDTRNEESDQLEKDLRLILRRFPILNTRPSCWMSSNEFSHLQNVFCTTVGELEIDMRVLAKHGNHYLSKKQQPNLPLGVPAPLPSESNETNPDPVTTEDDDLPVPNGDKQCVEIFFKKYKMAPKHFMSFVALLESPPRFLKTSSSQVQTTSTELTGSKEFFFDQDRAEERDVYVRILNTFPEPFKEYIDNRQASASISLEDLENLKNSKKSVSHSVCLCLSQLPCLRLRSEACNYVLNFGHAHSEVLRLCKLFNTLFSRILSSESFRKILTRSLVFGLYLNRTTRPKLSHGFSLGSLLLLKDVRSVQSPSANLKKKSSDNTPTTKYSFRHTSSAAPVQETRVSLLQVIVESDPVIFEQFTEEFSGLVEESLQSLQWLQDQLATLKPSLQHLKAKVPEMLKTNKSEINKHFVKAFQEFVEVAEPSLEGLQTEWAQVLRKSEEVKSYLCKPENPPLTSLLTCLHSVITDFKSTMSYIRRTSNPQAIY